MEQARLEVHAAQSDYDAITREIEDLDRQAQALREELEGVRTARRRYAQALEERQARIRQAGGARRRSWPGFRSGMPGWSSAAGRCRRPSGRAPEW